jgi:hypothetical protein
VSAHSNFLRQKARERVLTDGQGARKKKPHRGHRGLGGRRHKRSFRDLRKHHKREEAAVAAR